MTPEIVLPLVGDNPNKATLYYGQTVLDTLKELPSQSVQSIVTSPPYWSLRDYGTAPQVWGGKVDCEHEWGTAIRAPWANSVPGPSDNVPKNVTDDGGHWKTKEAGSFCQKCGAWFGDLGLEPTPELYVEHMVEIFREAKRVLRDDGTLWLNIGDSYAGGGGFSPNSPSNLAGAKQTTQKGAMTRGVPVTSGVKTKDLVGIPWMCAFALRADGWFLRADIIWQKINSMPEPVTDRPTRSHEHIFLLTKKPHYFYDHIAIQEPHTMKPQRRPEGRPVDETPRPDGKTKQAWPTDSRQEIGFDGPPGGRNKRDVWGISTCAYTGSHFAVMPPALAETMILAGTSKKGCCPHCGAPWKRVCDKIDQGFADRTFRSPHETGTDWNNNGAGKTTLAKVIDQQTTGWEPTCECPGNQEPVPCVVLDPFSGSGTTGMVALKLGRDYLGIDLNPDFLSLARARILGDAAPSKEADSDLSESIFDLF